ncbi:MAG TPA: hypothetical protein VGN26_13755 [Armatimonadota bacterium]|jgi:hypothetical protein
MTLTQGTEVQEAVAPATLDAMAEALSSLEESLRWLEDACQVLDHLSGTQRTRKPDPPPSEDSL